MNNLYKRLEKYQHRMEMQKRTNERRKWELVATARSAHLKGLLSAFDYIKIAEKNNTKSI